MKDEFDEERSLWNQIKSDARHVDQLMVSIQPRIQYCIVIYASPMHHQRSKGFGGYGGVQTCTT